MTVYIRGFFVDELGDDRAGGYTAPAARFWCGGTTLLWCGRMMGEWDAEEQPGILHSFAWPTGVSALHWCPWSLVGHELALWLIHDPHVGGAWVALWFGQA